MINGYYKVRDTNPRKNERNPNQFFFYTDAEDRKIAWRAALVCSQDPLSKYPLVVSNYHGQGPLVQVSP